MKFVDKVRASRDGHEFHEAWAARKALQLLPPDSDLTAIAVEGPAPADHVGASAAFLEVADLVLYSGGPPSFAAAKGTTIVQFKYSIAGKDKDFRAADAKKTLRKFGQTYSSYRRKYGAQAVLAKLDFQIISNRPISRALSDAISAIATGTGCSRQVASQAKQVRTACGLSGPKLVAFARKLQVIGRSSSLRQSKGKLASLLVDWSAAGADSIAAARLGRLRELVREKAGHAGTEGNLITRTDILAALQVGDPRDLLPCPSALANVGSILEREQLAEALARLNGKSAPLLIHATGGTGKTVFMTSLATKIAASHEVVFFDCFGGGAYRSPEDGRHLPARGLVHIANSLAFRGLCDPMLPDSPDLQALLSTFRRRLKQSVATLSRTTPGRQLALFLDAIDNSEIASRQRAEDCFPLRLVESLDTEPLAGVKLAVSCRTERKPRTYARFESFELQPFTRYETQSFLRARLRNVSQVEVNVAQARSGGNPRVLDYLLRTGRGLLDPSEIENRVELDDLLQERIQSALRAALERGHEENETAAFLAGLAVLPPPVPLDEYAGAHGVEVSAVESFASDLSPLLERTSQGLMFRDEPTETFVHQRYATSREALERLATRLLARQESSAYAARSLPQLLHELDDSSRLFALAFDERIPTSITSLVGRRNVQYARLRAATLHAANKRDYNSLVRLLLELSTIAAVDQRGVDFILDHPDLVAVANDDDARRRLFEVRTGWPGKRHARLAIAHSLLGEVEEAQRHVHAASEWLEHYGRTERFKQERGPGPEHTDVAAIPFFLLSRGRVDDAAQYLRQWRDWYVFEVYEVLSTCSHLFQTVRGQPARLLRRFNGALSSVGSIAAALSFGDVSRSSRKKLASRLAKLCKRATNISHRDHFSHHERTELEDGLRKSAAVALSCGLGAEAITICRNARHRRPGLCDFHHSYNHRNVLSQVIYSALVAAARKQAIHETDLLPHELTRLCSRIPRELTGTSFRERARKRLSTPSQQVDLQSSNAPKSLSSDERQSATRFLDTRLQPLLCVTRAISRVFSASRGGVDKAFVDLVLSWQQARTSRDPYSTDEIDPFFHLLGLEASLFALWVRGELQPESVKHLLATVHSHRPRASDIVRIVAILAKRPLLHDLAGQQAVGARALIEKEDDVNHRAALYGALGRALLPASLEEAAVYFRNGLEQMDAIGSGDYRFTNELLWLAAQIKGDELSEPDFHTLTNICELNLGEEPEKFSWGGFGAGIAKAAGLRGLAKLSRWDDRARIALGNTLLPYLTGLLEAGKLDGIDALSLNRLANPVEYYFAGTKEFAEALRRRMGPDPVSVAELIRQFEDDNPSIRGDATVETLCSLSTEALGASHEVSQRLRAMRESQSSRRDSRGTKENRRLGLSMPQRSARLSKLSRKELLEAASKADLLNETALSDLVTTFSALDDAYDFRAEFFSALRERVTFSGRGLYVRNIAALKNLHFHWKMAELKDARTAWADSTAALVDSFANLARPLVLAHIPDLVDDGRVSGSQIRELAELTGVEATDLILEMIKVFSRPNYPVAGSVWLAFASFIAPETDDGQVQLGLARLLSSEAARLSGSVADGPWERGRYPSTDKDEVLAGLIWRVLGSPNAEDRWRASHSLRSFARFGRWRVIDHVVDGADSKTAGAFQAQELAFYYLHARLWLAISLARLSLDHPTQIARYRDRLVAAAVESKDTHVLLRTFAARTLLTCVAASALSLPAETLALLESVGRSPFPRLKKKIRRGGGFFHSPPASFQERESRFHLDYDFHKHEVDSLGEVFGLDTWDVAATVSGIAQTLDPAVTSMYDDGGRGLHRQTRYGLGSRTHGYGQYLGWHALLFAAGSLLVSRPVTDDWWYDEPWTEWFSRYGLTREDGFWLSDGTDRMPIDSAVLLLEPRSKGQSVTGGRDELLKLAGVAGTCAGEVITIDASWTSVDNVAIEIRSALVPKSKGVQFARDLVREDPMGAWVPVFYGSEDDEEYLRGKKKDYTPWVVRPNCEARLDEHDPYGVSIATARPRIARKYITLGDLTRRDPFGRTWIDGSGTECLYAQAWGRNEDIAQKHPPGSRLLCRSSLIKKVLGAQEQDLLLLMRLQRYEKGHQSSGTYTHSIAVARIDDQLNIGYFRGAVNRLYKPRY